MEFVLLWATFVAIMLTDLERGIGIGIIMAVLYFAYSYAQASTPSPAPPPMQRLVTLSPTLSAKSCVLAETDPGAFKPVSPEDTQ